MNITAEKENICEETPVDLIVNNKGLVTFMCTPRNLKELAVGYLYNQGIINQLSEINYLGACEEMDTINVQILKDISDSQYNLRSVLSSSCGSSIDKKSLKSIGSVDSSLEISLEKLKDIAKEMFAQMVLYKKTGGVHCAAVADNSSLLYLREDVGRHNAVDKIIGQSVMVHLNLSNSLIVTTGRITSDMILKAAISGLPVVVSRSIPSNLALEIAREAKITVVGRITHNDPIVYTEPNRLVA
jgi:FdhD protein